MKKLLLVSLVLVIVVLGFLFVHARTNRTTGSDARIVPNKTTTFSSDGYTWQVGAVIMDGTNVPASQLQITPIHSTNVPPQTNEVSK